MPLYGITVGILITDDLSTVKSYYKDFSGDKVSSHCVFYEHKGDDVVIVILNPNSLTHPSIAHEVYHATSFVCLSRGIVADFNNDEPMAYIAGWLTDKVYSLIL